MKRAADMINKIKDNFVQLIETVILIACFILPFLVDVKGMFGDYLKENYLTPDNIFPYYVIKTGKYAIAAAMFTLFLWVIRKHNKEVIMNRINAYHNYPYAWYYYCAKILGIKKCSLILVPIYMQFKLVIQSTFDDYPLDMEDYPVLESEPDIGVSKTNWTSNLDEINMILEDTYQIEAFQIPREKRELPTVKISRNNKRGFGRHFSQKYIECVINETRGLSNGVRVNVFATTNPMNTCCIAKRAFKNATRGNVKELYVYQQESIGNRLFKGKGKKIY
jgi:hypothetical protein